MKVDSHLGEEHNKSIEDDDVCFFEEEKSMECDTK